MSTREVYNATSRTHTSVHEALAYRDRMTYHGSNQSEKYSLYTVNLITVLADAINAMNHPE